MFYNVLFNSLYIFYKISKYKNAISVKINSFTLYYHYQNISLLIYNSGYRTKRVGTLIPIIER